MVICGVLSFPAKQLQFFQTYRKGMQTRVGLVAAIYGKTLRLSSVSRPVEAGHVTNLASNDVERFFNASVATIYLVWGPLEAMAIVWVGLKTVGVAFVVGLGFLLVVLLPLLFYLSRAFVRLRRQVASRTDARVAWVTQAVGGARVVKLNAWELELERRIMTTRTDEVEKIQDSARFRALNEATYYAASLCVSVVIFLVDVFMGNSLNERKVFTTLTLTNILQMSLTRLVPNAIMGLSECYVSCQRIQSFLELPENRRIDAPREKDVDTTNADCDIVLSLSNVYCYWNKESNVALENLSISFQRGKLYCICGKVGSGKSALLLALAGELPVSSGAIIRNCLSLSFAEQEPWITNGSIRENIAMGLEFNQSWYDQVVDACGLRPDFSLLAAGDETVVGDRGMQLSGGQKARIALARTMYRDKAELVLLDDPLSAVDSNVAKRIVDGIRRLCILRGKTVILVTHQHRYIGTDAEYIVMEQGRAVCCGSYKACIGNNGIANESPIANEDAEAHDVQPNPEGIATEKTSLSKEGRDANEETKATGIVTFSTYCKYGKAMGGWPTAALIFCLFATTQGFFLWTIVVLGNWSEESAIMQQSARWVGLVTGLTAVVLFLSFLRATVTFHLLVKASQRLHNHLLHAVIRARIAWYDTQPLGRILNRFSADCGIADDLLPMTIFDFSVGFFVALGSVATAIAVLPLVLIVLPPLGWAFTSLRRTFVKTTRELKRFDGIARSPVYAMMSEALLGATTIRSNGLGPYCMRTFRAAHDAHTRAYFAFVSSSRRFAFQIDWFAFLLMATAILLAVLFNTQQWLSIDPSTLGLALTLLLQLSQTNLPWIVRQSSEVTNQMVSIERILEYCEAPQEAPFESSFDTDKEDWPREASICVDQFSTRYRSELPLVLRGVDFSIAQGKKVGVVGRTGSGKSSLVQALFRLIEADAGSISIDGVNIATIGLHKLRRAMSVIPQSPFLLAGATVRENLDPFSKYEDDELERALSSVQMLETVQKDLPIRLDSIVAEGGSNFSVGQRQLLCLARTILSKTKILVLDEATANVDVQTSELIYNSVDMEFKGATILSVAHRLESVIDFDLILVLGDGKVLQFGSPHQLLLDEENVFAGMIRAQGLSTKVTKTE